MKKIIASLSLFIAIIANAQTTLTQQVAETLSALPLKCINVEFPNKTGHTAIAEKDARMLPSELHPSFYGCLDWHSSVHGHWMLVKLLKQYSNMRNKDSIIAVLQQSFQPQKIKEEANYFTKYNNAKGFERAYGWAWLLKLDQELYTWNHPLAKQWYKALQPLTQQIISLWKAYLPKQTYPNRTGVHGNTAFALCFAYDWAIAFNDTAFSHAIKNKALQFYLSNKNIPAHLEPDGSDFFSPSLQAANIMLRVLPKAQFLQWFQQYYTQQGIDRLCELPTVSDRSDYQIVHLDGLCYSRAWCMRAIAKVLPAQHKYKQKFETTAQLFLNTALPQIFNGYGGEHWLASFAVYALNM